MAQAAYARVACIWIAIEPSDCDDVSLAKTGPQTFTGLGKAIFTAFPIFKKAIYELKSFGSRLVGKLVKGVNGKLDSKNREFHGEALGLSAEFVSWRALGAYHKQDN